MAETIGVVIASYGDRSAWNTMAVRALNSVCLQTLPPDEVYRIHRNSLHEARNEGALALSTEYVCFLDCDDELEPDYLRSMMSIPTQTGKMYLRYPMVRYVSESMENRGRTPAPIALPSRPLWQGNFLVIGTVIKRDLFIRAEGFRDIHAYEDWDLWLRCWILGADPVLVRGAIYKAWRRRGSRNAVAMPQGLCSEIINYNKKWKAGLANDKESSEPDAKSVLADNNGRQAGVPPADNGKLVEEPFGKPGIHPDC